MFSWTIRMVGTHREGAIEYIFVSVRDSERVKTRKRVKKEAE
jgi:hypothetical protein